MAGGTRFHFITDGIHVALERARAAAGGRDVRLGGGVATIREYLRAGLVEEMHLAIAPVLLGAGEALFAGIDLLGLGFAVTEQVATPHALHVVLGKAAQAGGVSVPAPRSRPAGRLPGIAAGRTQQRLRATPAGGGSVSLRGCSARQQMEQRPKRAQWWALVLQGSNHSPFDSPWTIASRPPNAGGQEARCGGTPTRRTRYRFAPTNRFNSPASIPRRLTISANWSSPILPTLK